MRAAAYEPAEVNILAKAVADYCESHKIKRVDEREDIALKAMGLFRRGVTDLEQLLQELERVGQGKPGPAG
ncbi:MAG: hypothetical protein EOS61_14975 [Mesorhizobium sp.]|nr:MAG: hypothetical protein EOS61_14975 [Mesorhizobium sp.]